MGWRSRLGNGEHGYGPVTRILHWLTLLLLVTQFVVGYSLDDADLLALHAGLGVALLLVVSLRLAWRRTAGLPPWAPGYSAGERRLVGLVEKGLYLVLFVIPLSGLALVLGSGEDFDLGDRSEWQAPYSFVEDDLALGIHVAGHVAFFVLVAAHVGVVLKHQWVDRDGLLRRML